MIKDISGDPEALRKIALLVVDMMENTCHMKDSALVALQEYPDWRKHYDEAMASPLRQQHTHELMQNLRTLIDALCSGQATYELLDELAARLSKLPN